MARLATSLAALTLVLVLSKTLEAELFGRYAGAVALVAILGIVFRLGAAELMVEQIASGWSVNSAYGRALAVSCLMLLLGVVAATAAAAMFFSNVSAAFVAALATGEFLTTFSLSISNRLLYAKDQPKKAALLTVLSASVRLCAAVSILIIPLRSLTDLGVRLLLAGIVGASAQTWFLAHRFGRPELSLSTSFDDLRKGLAISVGMGSEIVSTRADQMLLLRQGLDREAGIYGFGARMVSQAMLPAQALLDVLFAKQFQAALERGDQSRALVRNALPALLSSGVLMAVGLLGLAPVAESFLGPSFDDVALVLTYLAAFPLVRSTQMLLGDALTGHGLHERKSRTTLAFAVTNIGLNLALIPVLGWQGAVLTTYLTEVGQLAAFWRIFDAHATKMETRQ